ncbi:uncharacterized protein DDB_G0279979-like [Abrus precatorius]|uniref:Uncharacterized protein DDB_G0279979-like n=1 Tax=Abrus precatorius TaxID=3816 RepID=A0A8B8KNG0_ABRPR|nr:uncharacterized protein DDB_G0279979-like [Abrus precatorius]
MFGGGGKWLRFSERLRFLTTSVSTNARTSSFCTTAKNNTNSTDNNNVNIADERYRQLQNLDMMTAAKILFTDPPQKKKFGFDFHLVQFFFACLPSLAVYLVAQYARYEMRKMEVEVEQKRKQKEEEEAKEKEKEMELNPPEEKEEKSDPELSEVKVRLEKLEEAVKEIVVETKTQSSNNQAKNLATDDEKKQLNSSAPKDTKTTNSAPNEENKGSVATPNEENKGSVTTSNSPLPDPKGQNQSGGVS